MYGSSFMFATLRPRFSISAPIDAETMPLPSDETTPPVTNTNLVCCAMETSVARKRAPGAFYRLHRFAQSATTRPVICEIDGDPRLRGRFAIDQLGGRRMLEDPTSVARSRRRREPCCETRSAISDGQRRSTVARERRELVSAAGGASRELAGAPAGRGAGTGAAVGPRRARRR